MKIESYKRASELMDMIRVKKGELIDLQEILSREVKLPDASVAVRVNNSSNLDLPTKDLKKSIEDKIKKIESELVDLEKEFEKL